MDARTPHFTTIIQLLPVYETDSTKSNKESGNFIRGTTFLGQMSCFEECMGVNACK